MARAAASAAGGPDNDTEYFAAFFLAVDAGVVGGPGVPAAAVNPDAPYPLAFAAAAAAAAADADDDEFCSP
eukprot:scaffold318456_cov36-Prasinocladus_malaysianus.AAC.1